MPDCIIAGRKAVAPGKHSTGILLRIHALTNKKPGSDIPGVPASVIKANVLPSFNWLIRCSKILCSLCWW